MRVNFHGVRIFLDNFRFFVFDNMALHVLPKYVVVVPLAPLQLWRFDWGGKAICDEFAAQSQPGGRGSRLLISQTYLIATKRIGPHGPKAAHGSIVCCFRMSPAPKTNEFGIATWVGIVHQGQYPAFAFWQILDRSLRPLHRSPSKRACTSSRTFTSPNKTSDDWYA